MFDVATLGRLGYVPGWPGEKVAPSQPMVAQTRAVLERYGRYDQIVFAGCGHSPHIERAADFATELARVVA